MIPASSQRFEWVGMRFVCSQDIQADYNAAYWSYVSICVTDLMDRKAKVEVETEILAREGEEQEIGGLSFFRKFLGIQSSRHAAHPPCRPQSTPASLT